MSLLSIATREGRRTTVENYTTYNVLCQLQGTPSVQGDPTAKIFVQPISNIIVVDIESRFNDSFGPINTQYPYGTQLLYHNAFPLSVIGVETIAYGNAVWFPAITDPVPEKPTNFTRVWFSILNSDGEPILPIVVFLELGICQPNVLPKPTI